MTLSGRIGVERFDQAFFDSNIGMVLFLRDVGAIGLAFGRRPHFRAGRLRWRNGRLEMVLKMERAAITLLKNVLPDSSAVDLLSP